MTDPSLPLIGCIDPEIAMMSPQGLSQYRHLTFNKPLQGQKKNGMPLSEVSDVSVKYGPTSSSACRRRRFELVTCPDSRARCLFNLSRGSNHQRAKSISLTHAMNCQHAAIRICPLRLSDPPFQCRCRAYSCRKGTQTM